MSGDGENVVAMEEGIPRPQRSESGRRRYRSVRDIDFAHLALGTRNIVATVILMYWRRSVAIMIYVIALVCLFSLVASGALDWTLVGWVVVAVSGILGMSFWLARFVGIYVTGTAGSRRGRLRPGRAALEARLQRHHPGIDLARLRLLLVDRDFTGEDYQALLDLDENNEVPSTVGATESEIRRNPSFVISEPPRDSVSKPRNCSVCLYPFKPGEHVRIIPCLHQFHTECIDPWLRQNAICPVCKFPAVG